MSYTFTKKEYQSNICKQCNLITNGTWQRNWDKYEWTYEALDDSTWIKWQFEENKKLAWKKPGQLTPQYMQSIRP